MEPTDYIKEMTDKNRTAELAGGHSYLAFMAEIGHERVPSADLYRMMQLSGLVW